MRDHLYAVVGGIALAGWTAAGYVTGLHHYPNWVLLLLCIPAFLLSLLSAMLLHHLGYQAGVEAERHWITPRSGNVR